MINYPWNYCFFRQNFCHSSIQLREVEWVEFFKTSFSIRLNMLSRLRSCDTMLQELISLKRGKSILMEWTFSILSFFTSKELTHVNMRIFCLKLFYFFSKSFLFKFVSLIWCSLSCTDWVVLNNVFCKFFKLKKSLAVWKLVLQISFKLFKFLFRFS